MFLSFFQVWERVFPFGKKGKPKAAPAPARGDAGTAAAEAETDVAMMQLVAVPSVGDPPCSPAEEEPTTQMQLCVFDGDAPDAAEAWIVVFHSTSAFVLG